MPKGFRKFKKSIKRKVRANTKTKKNIKLVKKGGTKSKFEFEIVRGGDYTRTRDGEVHQHAFLTYCDDKGNRNPLFRFFTQRERGKILFNRLFISCQDCNFTNCFSNENDNNQNKIKLEDMFQDEWNENPSKDFMDPYDGDSQKKKKIHSNIVKKITDKIFEQIDRIFNKLELSCKEDIEKVVYEKILEYEKYLDQQSKEYSDDTQTKSTIGRIFNVFGKK